MRDLLKVYVDPEICQGHTLCAMAAPDVFLLADEDGHAYVQTSEVSIEFGHAIRRAVATCPEGAITIEE